MNGREGVGVAAVLAGILIIVGAAKGTWRQVWTDLTGNVATSSSGSGGYAGSSSSPSGPVSVGPGGVVIGPHILPVPLPSPIGGIQFQSYQPTVLPYTPMPGTSGYGFVPAQ